MSYCDWSITIDDVSHPFGQVEVSSWVIGGREYRTDDTSRPRTDGRYFGQDFADPGDIEINLIIRAKGTDRQTKFDNAMSLREEFTSVWNGDTIRFTPGSVAELHIAGRIVVEGRPRHVDWDDSLATFGIIKGNALFVRNFDQAFGYDETTGGSQWEEVTVGLVPPQMGGLIAPLVAPLSTATTSTRARPFEVGGEGDAWPVIYVQGPLQSGASVELVHGWTLKLNRSLAYDEVAVLDSRPGSRTMTVNGRATNLLSPAGDRLSQTSISPGIQEVALRGTSLEGTATVTLRWREVKKVI